jgi:hypothetical protein
LILLHDFKVFELKIKRGTKAHISPALLKILEGWEPLRADGVRAEGYFREGRANLSCDLEERRDSAARPSSTSNSQPAAQGPDRKKVGLASSRG